MMLKEKSSPWARLKYLYVLPVAVVAVTAFARPEVKNELNELSAVKVNDLVAIVETTALEKVQQEVKKDTINKKQRKTPPPPPPAISDEKAAANGKKNKGTPPPPPVIHKKVVFVEAKAPEVEGVTDDWTFYIDGVEVKEDEPRNLDGVSITFNPEKKQVNITIPKKEERTATPKGGEYITMKGAIKDEDGNPVIGASVVENGGTAGTVSDLDGRYMIEVKKAAGIKVVYIGKKTEVRLPETNDKVQEVNITLSAD